MAIVASQILFYYPAVSSEGSNHGGTSTANTIPTTKNALWDDVSGAEAASGDTEYRKVFVGLHSDAGSQVLSNPVAWIASTTPATGDSIYLKTATAAADSSNVVSDLAFSDFASGRTAKSLGVTLDNLVTGDAEAIWLARVVVSGAGAYANNSGVLRVEGETA